MFLLLRLPGPVLLGVLAAALLFSGIYLSETMQAWNAEALAETPQICAQDLETVEPMLYIIVSQVSLFTALIVYVVMAYFVKRELS